MLYFLQWDLGGWGEEEETKGEEEEKEQEDKHITKDEKKREKRKDKPVQRIIMVMDWSVEALHFFRFSFQLCLSSC